jgi:hypothetical protein
MAVRTYVLFLLAKLFLGLLAKLDVIASIVLATAFHAWDTSFWIGQQADKENCCMELAMGSGA